MIEISDVIIDKINYEAEIGESRLEFDIKGNNINYIIINTLRRILYSHIPIYAFTEFKFEKNTSIYHNSYLTLRINQLPVWEIDNNVIIFNDTSKIENDIENLNEDIEDIAIKPTYEINSSSLMQLTMYINFINKNNTIVDVTTNHALFYYGGKQISSPYKIPIQIVKLQPGNEITFTAITSLGIGETNAIFCAVSVSAYKQHSPNHFTFFLESRGQLDEYTLLERGIKNIEAKLDKLLELIIENTELAMLTEGSFSIDNEDHTLGNLIVDGMQNHNDISFAGYNLAHPMATTLNIHFKLKNNTIQNIIKDVNNYYKKLFNKIIIKK